MSWQSLCWLLPYLLFTWSHPSHLFWLCPDPQMQLYLWEVMTMALPDSRARATVSQSRRRATGSMPVDGSSRKMTAGSPMRAMPVLSLRLLPPLEMDG